MDLKGNIVHLNLLLNQEALNLVLNQIANLIQLLAVEVYLNIKDQIVENLILQFQGFNNYFDGYFN